MRSFGPANALPQNIIDAMSPSERKELGVKTTEERMKASEAKSEKQIQSEVEAYLVQLGYWRRSTDNILRGMSPSGYFIHYGDARRAKNNPILLDLLILSHTGDYLELELKTETGKVRPEQEALIAYGGSLARGSLPAVDKIREWHYERINGRSECRKCDCGKTEKNS